MFSLFLEDNAEKVVEIEITGGMCQSVAHPICKQIENMYKEMYEM